MIAFCVTVARVRAALCLAALVMLASCSSTGKPSPEDLGANVALLGVKPVWVNALGDSGLSLEPRAVGSNIFAASSDGTVASIDARTGADVWRAKLDVGLSSGVGTDGKYVAVASRENEGSSSSRRAFISAGHRAAVGTAATDRGRTRGTARTPAGSCRATPKAPARTPSRSP